MNSLLGRLLPALTQPRFQLARLLERDANNLDLVRLLCACAVIFGHAFVVAPDPVWNADALDPTVHLGYPGVYSGSIAVKIFFLISGLLVTNSLLVRKSVSHFVLGRVFRIWPALTVVLICCAALIGPWLTVLDVRAYFSRYAVYRYVVGNFLMAMPADLPGMFVENNLAGAVNAVLWTLPIEVAAYFALLLTTVLGLFRHRLLAAVVLLFIIVDPLLPRPILTSWMDPNPQLIFLPSCFAFGACLALFKHRVLLSPGLVLAGAAAACALHQTRFGPLSFFFSLFYALLYVSGLPLLRRIKLKSDYSYGTFLWGFVVQQIVAERYGDLGFLFNFGVSLAITLGLGILSWHWVERPAMRLGRRLAERWTGKEAVQALENATPSHLFP